MQSTFQHINNVRHAMLGAKSGRSVISEEDARLLSFDASSRLLLCAVTRHWIVIFAQSPIIVGLFWEEPILVHTAGELSR